MTNALKGADDPVLVGDGTRLNIGRRRRPLRSSFSLAALDFAVAGDGTRLNIGRRRRPLRSSSVSVRAA